MPTRSKLTVMGMYNYDDTLFDNMILPEGIETEAAIMRILFDNATLELQLPHFDILKEMIGVWSKSNFYKWKTLYDTTQQEYNPLWNVDANESETTEREYESNKSGSFTESGTTSSENESSKTASGTNGNTKTLNTTTNDDNTRTLNTTTTADNFGKLAGFNSNNYNNVTNNSGTTSDTGTITDGRITKDTGTVTDAGTTSGTESSTDSGSGTSSNSGSNEGTDNITETVTITKRRTGNIGVTMTQQLLEAERKLAQFSIYEVISNDFKHYFCIMVY